MKKKKKETKKENGSFPFPLVSPPWSFQLGEEMPGDGWPTVGRRTGVPWACSQLCFPGAAVGELQARQGSGLRSS